MADIVERIENFLGEKISSEHSLGGGCIANARRIEMESGKSYFLKSYSHGGSAILRNEANGLKELRKAAAIRIPEVIMCDDTFLLTEYIESGYRIKNFSEVFGKQFALMHRYKGKRFGFYEDNYIGATPQINRPQYNNWIEFYWENRLMYQYRLAEKNGYASDELKEGYRILEEKIHDIIGGSEEEPAVMHGDLWGGNYMIDEKGEPCLIDPAVYYGHREADLAMTMIFGGFDARFYSAYNEEYPLPEGWEYRSDIYKLYHIMNHLNIFGTGYYSQALRLINSYS
jgi:fructosamine-3-kinase